MHTHTPHISHRTQANSAGIKFRIRLQWLCAVLILLRKTYTKIKLPTFECECIHSYIIFMICRCGHTSRGQFASNLPIPTTLYIPDWLAVPILSPGDRLFFLRLLLYQISRWKIFCKPSLINMWTLVRISIGKLPVLDDRTHTCSSISWYKFANIIHNNSLKCRKTQNAHTHTPLFSAHKFSFFPRLKICHAIRIDFCVLSFVTINT